MALPAAHIGFEGSSRLIPDTKSTWVCTYLGLVPVLHLLLPSQHSNVGNSFGAFPPSSSSQRGGRGDDKWGTTITSGTQQQDPDLPLPKPHF